MFTDEDYEKYFDQIGRVERKMIYGAYDLAEEIREPAILRLLQRVGEDEIRHYGLIFKMLKSMGVPRQSEKRCESREYYLGAIQLKRSQDPDGNAVKIYCVNISRKGVCFEGAADLPRGETCEMEIRLYDQKEVISRRGRVVWNKQVEPGFYIGGIVFDAASEV